MTGSRLPLGLAVLVLAPTAWAEGVTDLVMYRDPELPRPRIVHTLHPRLPALWVEVLGRRETDLKTQAAQAIALAHQKGLPRMDETIASLASELLQADVPPATRMALARALVVLDARGKAAELAQAANLESELHAIVDPALARWHYRPARAGWLERLARSPDRPGTISAIQALGTVREEKAIPRLRELAQSPTVPASVRLEAGRALGTIRREGAEADVRHLLDASRAGMIDRLVAAALLRHHGGREAIPLLQTLARDREPAVTAVALARLVEIDTALVLPVLDLVMASPDAQVRGYGVEVLLKQPTANHVRLLADRLSDPHPDVRTRARNALGELAGQPAWREEVISQGTRVLADRDWRGLEQAAILLAELDHKPAAGRLVELLPHGRPEVFVTAAGGLRRLAVAETLAAALAYFNAQFQRMLAGGSTAGRPGVSVEAVDQQLALLAQFFGQQRYRPADSLLRRLIPPPIGKPGNPAGFEARAAAIWALGLIHEGQAVPALVTALAGRLAAVQPLDVEDTRVRQMSAIALGRMKAADALNRLREFYPEKKPSLDPVSTACGWAIEQITGEKMPAAGTVDMPVGGWFLTPAE